MKRLAVFLLITSLSLPVAVHAAAQDVLITAVQTESAVNASEEYITITNNTSSTIDISGWHLQYFSASAANFDAPSRDIALTGSILPQTNYIAASTGYKVDVANVSFGASLAAAGGHVRLVSGTGTSEVQHDLLGWGSAQHPEGSAIPVVAKGRAYQRRTTDGVFIDTDNNAADFADSVVEVPPVSTGSDEPSNSGSEPTVSGSPAKLQITELLPDPAAPGTDANDEFVELYNPNDTIVDLTGYKLQTGSNSTYSYTFKSGSLAVGEYKAFFASETKLTLSNTSGKARLLDKNGQVVSETGSYGKAPTGNSWMLDGATWVWTTTPTPNAANGAAVLGATTTTAAAKATVVKTPKVSTTKAKAASKTTAAKSTASTAHSDYKTPASDNKALPVNALLLAAIGVPLVGYMLYEYRHDLANFVARTRRNRTNRREARTVSSGR